MNLFGAADVVFIKCDKRVRHTTAHRLFNY